MPNWTKFNPRSDRASHSWLRLENRFFDDPKIFLLDGDEQRVFLFILCLASRTSKDKVDFVAEQVAGSLRISTQKVRDAVSNLIHNELVRCHGAIVTPPTMTPAQESKTAPCLTTNERTNERTNVTDEGAAAAECLWENPDIQEFLSDVSPQGQKAWLCFGDRIWLEGEIKTSMSNWYTNAESRAKYDGMEGGKALYVNRWLTRTKRQTIAPPPNFDPPLTPLASVTRLSGWIEDSTHPSGGYVKIMADAPPS